jgi:putative lipoprotein
MRAFMALAALMLMAGSACTAPPPATVSVDGLVVQRSRNALPPGTVVNVRLLDVSRADAPSVMLAEQRIELGNRQLPVPFALSVAADRLDPRMSYAVAADARLDGQLLMFSTNRHPVLTRGAPSGGVAVLLDPVAQVPPAMPR